jgi:hypothetical protein
LGNHTFTRNDNARSPGYIKAIEWLSNIWEEFSSHHIINSFESCGIMNQYAPHKALQQVITTKTSLNDYVDDANPSDEIDGFVSGEDMEKKMKNS